MLAAVEKRSRARSWLSWLQVRREGDACRGKRWGVLRAKVGVKVVRRRREIGNRRCGGLGVNIIDVYIKNGRILWNFDVDGPYAKSRNQIV